MLKQFLLFLFIMLPFLAKSQEPRIFGTVKDAETLLPVAGAIIRIRDNGIVTDKDGHFNLTKVKKGENELEASYIGYKTYSQKLTITENVGRKIDILLRPESHNLNEIIITGATRQTLARENPIPVSTVTTKQLNQTSQNNIIDALVENTPGLNAVKTGPNISKPFIRGLGYNRVLTLYDGIRQEGQQWGDEHGLEVDDYNIERVEVIKGPSSLMFGSDALAGVVSLFSDIPHADDGKIHGRGISEYQTNNGLIGNGLRLGYSNKKWLFAWRGSFRMARDYRNAKDGRVYLTNFKTGNASALVGYKSDKGYTRLNFTLYNNRQGIPDGSRDSVSRKFTKQIFEIDRDENQTRPVVEEKTLKSYKVPALSQHIRHYRLFLNSLYKLGNGEIGFDLAGQQNVRREYNHPTEPAQAGMYVRLNTLNYGIKYHLPKIENLEISLGANGMAQHNKNLDATDFPIPDYDLFDFGTYLYAKWKKNNWTASGGVRYDIRKEKWRDFYVKNDPVKGFNKETDAGDPLAELQFPRFRKTFQDVSASLGLTYSISEEISLKANIGHAFRAPNITELASNGLDPGAHIIYKGDRTFQPEQSLQEDLGISAGFTDWTFEVSFFNNDIRNYIYLNTVPDDDGNPLMDNQGNRTYQYQQTKAQLFGGELWFSLHPERWDGLRFDNSISVVYGYNRDLEFRKKKNDGEYLPLIPPFHLLSKVVYPFTLSKKWITDLTPKLELDYHARQDHYFGLNNTETATPSYLLWNMGISADVPYSASGSFQLLIQVNNLFDKVYQSHLSRLKYFEDYDNGHGIYNMGRNIAVKIVVPF